MALPSSPPLPPELELDNVSSPLPALDDSAYLPTRPSLVPITSRKRHFSDHESNSSDPYFSEDFSDAGLEHDQPRRKRVVRGPWWRVGSLRRTAMAKRERVWNDSGVWLGSDASHGSDDTIDDDDIVSYEEKATSVGLQPAWKALPGPSARLSPAETLAAKAINICVDTGRETVDLSGFALPELSDSTLRPLHQLIRHTHSDLTHPPSEDEFSPLTPSIKLFLSGNSLSTLPFELCTLNIVVLSLRNNRLTHIPPAISRLSNLEELNIAQNDIKCLPWDMLDLFHCRGNHRQIITRPNPLLDPVPDLREAKPLHRPRVTPSEFMEHLSRWGETNGAFFQKMREWYGDEGEPWTIRQELELKLKLGRLKRTNYLQEASRAGAEIQLCKEQLIYLASSAIRYFEVDGSPLRNTFMSRSVEDGELYSAVVDPHFNAPPASEQSAVPSLFELSLRSIQAVCNLNDTIDLPDGIPSSVISGLQKAVADARSQQTECCSTCGKRFIIARAEWMEFWFNGFPSQECLTQESVLPFLRRACSWMCAQPSELGSFRV